MSEKAPIFLLIRLTQEGDFQLSLGNNREQVKERMVNDGWRVFEMGNEKFAHDLSA